VDVAIHVRSDVGDGVSAILLLDYNDILYFTGSTASPDEVIFQFSTSTSAFFDCTTGKEPDFYFLTYSSISPVIFDTVFQTCATLTTEQQRLAMLGRGNPYLTPYFQW